MPKLKLLMPILGLYFVLFCSSGFFFCSVWDFFLHYLLLVVILSILGLFLLRKENLLPRLRVLLSNLGLSLPNLVLLLSLQSTVGFGLQRRLTLRCDLSDYVAIIYRPRSEDGEDAQLEMDPEALADFQMQLYR